MEILNNLMISLEISDMLVILLGVIGSFIISINKSSNEKSQVSTFILGYYSLVLIYLIFNQILGLTVNERYAPFFLLLAVHMSKSMTIAIFNKDEIIQFLSSFQILKYYFFEVFFTSRLEVTYIYGISIIFVSNSTLKIVFTLTFLFIQLLLQIKNNFEVIPFQELYRKQFKNLDKNRIKDEQDEIIRLSYIIYLEDRDFTVRKSFLFKIHVILLRKYLQSINRYDFGKDYLILDRKLYRRYDLNYIKKDVFSILWYLTKSLKKIPSLLTRRLWRGYGTLPQQVVRVRALKNYGTYNSNKIRRKLFVENIYTSYFYKAMIKRNSQIIVNDVSIRVDKSSKKDVNELSLLLLRRDILYAYYVNILKSPDCDEELITNMKKFAKTSKSTKELNSKWDNKFNDQIFHIIYNSVHWNIFRKIRNDLYTND